ncbi:DNA methylase [Cellulomonas sp. H30R-01]|uniref:DNA methylase n=1 Tax=Cellulomonas sp. H30R-01 TaxID=2704467 RepID=UPI00138D631B|nr:DNA methylase [Cellulomonas sp. H30R-01]QHT54728.1 DNA methylase [Cellulomonas sp. H30R-01]
MATAPGHLLGQIIGNVMEEALRPVLQDMASRHDLYLDSKGPRPGVRPGAKVSWEDDLGNTHDLDFVLERGGDASKAGNPAAFVEAAWRRYTKHSKAKAQEIQGAVLPVLAKWNNVKPTPAAVVAGLWSAPSLQQLRSSGFVVLHLEFATTVEVFRSAGIDIQGLGEDTPDSFWRTQCDAYANLSATQKSHLANALGAAHAGELQTFVSELERRVVRTIDHVVVTPLHGSGSRFMLVADAIAAVKGYSCGVEAAPFVRFEIRITYTNADVIQATFGSPADAVDFLDTFV